MSEATRRFISQMYTVRAQVSKKSASCSIKESNKTATWSILENHLGLLAAKAYMVNNCLARIEYRTAVIEVARLRYRRIRAATTVC